MKVLRIMMTLLGALLLTNCSDDFEQGTGIVPSHSGQVSFLFGLQQGDASMVQTRGGKPEQITRMWYAVANERREIIKPLYQKLKENFSKLTIEELGMGDYTVVFLVTTSEEEDETVRKPEKLSGDWLINHMENASLDAVYFYKKIELHISRDQASVPHTVVSGRSVRRVDVDLNVSSDHMQRSIRKIDTTFDDTEGIYVTLGADGKYSGTKKIESYDIIREYSFHSLPDAKALSGLATIEPDRNNGIQFVHEYRFTDCETEADHISHISIDYLHPESQDGSLCVRKEDFFRFRTNTTFLASKPREAFYDGRRRSFYTNAPLQVPISDGHQLLVKFFSSIGIQDVKIMHRFNRLSMEFLELAHFEQIYPFMETSFPLPVVDSKRIFTTSGGRKIAVPTQPGLSNDDMAPVIRTEDPSMKKIEQIDSHWFIRFSSYSADNGHAYWHHTNPLLRRHGVALAINVAFMFSSEEFSMEMNKCEGLLEDNGGNPISLDTLRRGIRNHDGLALGCVAGVGRLGRGNTYGLANYCYTGVCFDATPPNAHPHNYPHQAMFHEYGYCFGYDHSSTMTCGDQWTVLCATVFVNVGKNGELSVCSKEIIAQLPI